MTGGIVAKVLRIARPQVRELTSASLFFFRARFLWRAGSWDHAPEVAMPKKDRARKADARARQRATGAPYAAANSGADHRHPAPDLSMLDGSAYSGGRPVDTPAAAALVGACRAGCGPCQQSLIERAVQDRVLVAVLVGAVYGMLPVAGFLAAPTTRRVHPLARQAHDSGDGAPLLAAVDALDEDDLADLLDDALDHWAAGGADLEVHTLPADDPDEEDNPDGTPVATGAPSYALYPGGRLSTPNGPLPFLTLEPETPEAGVADMRARCRWQPWDLRTLPVVDTAWRLRVDIASRTLREIVHVDEDGYDDVELWEAAETVRLPDDWFDLLDRAEHVLLCGPVTGGPAGLERAAETGTLTAVIARARFF